VSTTARPAPPADTSPPAVPAGAAHEWRVTGMDCGACVAKVRGAVERLPGVHDVDVTLVSERLRVTLDDDASRDTAPIEAAIRALGYGIEAVSAPAAATRWYASGKGRLVLGTGALLVGGVGGQAAGPGRVVAAWAFGVGDAGRAWRPWRGAHSPARGRACRSRSRC
jgi:Cd2+/Zn2+-exporting ATPase